MESESLPTQCLLDGKAYECIGRMMSPPTVSGSTGARCAARHLIGHRAGRSIRAASLGSLQSLIVHGVLVFARGAPSVSGCPRLPTVAPDPEHRMTASKSESARLRSGTVGV